MIEEVLKEMLKYIIVIIIPLVLSILLTKRLIKGRLFKLVPYENDKKDYNDKNIEDGKLVFTSRKAKIIFLTSIITLSILFYIGYILFRVWYY